MNLRKYLKEHKTQKGYDVVKMLKLVLFCHMEGFYSLRKMTDMCKYDIILMWLTEEMKPSHNAIAEFLNKNLKNRIEDVFVEINNHLLKKVILILLFFMLMEQSLKPMPININGCGKTQVSQTKRNYS